MKYKMLPVIVAAFALHACEAVVHEPTKISQGRMTVSEEKIFEDVAAKEMSSAVVSALAQDHALRGSGPLEVSVTYDPHSKGNTAMHASEEAARIAELFAAQGSPVKTGIVPVKGQGDEARVLVSYYGDIASGPEDCDLMPGLTHKNIDPEDAFELGCTIDTLVAKQVARPGDLNGRTQTDPTTDGRRASNIIDLHRTGVPNEPLEGETASE